MDHSNSNAKPLHNSLLLRDKDMLSCCKDVVTGKDMCKKRSLKFEADRLKKRHHK